MKIEGDIKLIVSDMDGTLVGSDHHISKENVLSIQRAQQEGIEFAVATGRLYSQTYPQLKEAGIKCRYIVMNGAEYRDENGVILKELSLDKKEVKRILNYFTENNIYIEIYTNEGVFTTSSESVCVQAMFDKSAFFGEVITGEDAAEKAKMHSEYRKLQFISNEDELLKNPQICIGKLQTFSSDEALLKEVKKCVSEIAQVSVTASFPINLEITNVKATKAALIEVLIQERGYTHEQVMVIGDSYNDYEMFKTFPISAAMGNAIPELKEIANFITDDNDHAGVGKAIEKILYVRGKRDEVR